MMLCMKANVDINHCRGSVRFVVQAGPEARQESCLA